MAKRIKIEYAERLTPIFQKKKRIKIIVGGRASTKSTAVADYVAACMASGQLWCCARENQNSIEESVHRTILDEISRLEVEGFDDTKTSIVHQSGGRAFYRGLARNITSLKSTLSGIDGLWIEEGEDLSDNSLRVLTASVRLNAKDSQRLISGEDVKMPEIIITMNRGARTGAIAKTWLHKADSELMRCGYYEDEEVMIVQINYTDIPREWFLASGLEIERQKDKDRLSDAAYRHKWHGDYLEEVENAIIKPEWFEACIDAHKIDRLKKMFDPKGAIIAAHDPFDGGNDAGGYAVRHGSIIKRVCSKSSGEVDEVCDWATGMAIKDGADWFVWDGDGMGTGLKRQVADAFRGTKIEYHIFKGSLSGSGIDNADDIYLPDDSDKSTKPKTHSETFRNNRARYYIDLATRMHNTYRCVVKGDYVDPINMVSFDSEGIENMELLRSELCRIPRKENATGLEQIMSKQEMKAKYQIPSPNMADSVMYCMWAPPIKRARKQINYPKMSIA